MKGNNLVAGNGNESRFWINIPIKSCNEKKGAEALGKKNIQK